MCKENDAKKHFGLIGYPLGHSMSGVIHNELFRIAGLDADYTMIEIEPERLSSAFDAELKDLDGFNVTIPHKINIIPCLDNVSDRAGLFGAVNTVKCGDTIVGHNTDCSGFLRALEMADIDLKGDVLLLGSGGVARMIAFEAILAGASLTIAVRDADVDAANAIKAEIEQKLDKTCKVMLLNDVEGGYDLIINGTPVGMFPNCDACPVIKEVVQSCKSAFDVIYNPQETLFIQYAKEAGLKYSGGLSMLVGQAAVAEEIWNGVSFTKQDIEEVIAITQRELDK